MICPAVEKMEQNTSDGSEEKADELEEGDGEIHVQTFRGNGMGIVYVGEGEGMREMAMLCSKYLWITKMYQNKNIPY